MIRLTLNGILNGATCLAIAILLAAGCNAKPPTQMPVNTASKPDQEQTQQLANPKPKSDESIQVKGDKPKTNIVPRDSGTPTDDKTMQTVIADGVGATSDEAIKDAFRNAIRQVVGAVVDAETLVKNDDVIRDDIIAYSKGFIVGYDKLSEKEDRRLIRVTIRAKVERSKVVRELQVAKISTRKVDLTDIVEEAEEQQKRQKLEEIKQGTRKEQQKQASKLFARALEKIPESLIEAKIVGEPQMGTVNGSKTSLRITVRFSVSMQAYNAFLERLKKSLEGLSLRQGEFTMVSAIDTKVYWHMLPSDIDGFSGDHSVDEVLLAVNTHRTKSHNRTEWLTYALPLETECTLKEVSAKPVRIKLSLVSKDELVATDRFDGKVVKYGHPNLVYFGGGYFDSRMEYFQGTACKPLAKGVWVISPYFFTSSWIQSRRVIDNSYQTTLDIVREIELDLEEVKRITDVHCELFWGETNKATH